MPNPMSRPARRRVLAAAGVAALASLVLGGTGAAASQGSVPAEVAAYAADPHGLLERLDDLAGVGDGGKGIQFDDSAKVGQLNRIFVFTADYLAGAGTETPVERANEWSAPIELGGKPLGLATIWINPATVEPELADFEQGSTIGAALVDVPADAYLVHDEPRGAWFTLVGTELTPVVPGTSGLDVPTELAAYQELLAEQAGNTPAPPAPVTGSVLSVVVIVAVILFVVAVLLFPILRDRRRGRQEALAAEARRQEEEAAAAARAAEEAARAAAARAAKKPAPKKPTPKKLGPKKPPAKTNPTRKAAPKKPSA